MDEAEEKDVTQEVHLAAQHILLLNDLYTLRGRQQALCQWVEELGNKWPRLREYSLFTTIYADVHEIVGCVDGMIVHVREHEGEDFEGQK